MNGIRQKIDEKKSLKALCTLVRSLVDKQERSTVYTIYFNYDSQETTTSNISLKHFKTLPVIFEDDDYDPSVKGWLFANITPEDYMNIDVAQIDDSSEQRSVMEIDDLGEQSTVNEAFCPMNYSTPSHAFQLQNKMSTIKDSKTSTLKDMLFVLTGQPKYMIRAELTTLIRLYQGDVRNTVSRKTKFLVSGVDGGDSKKSKAEDMKIRVIDEDELFLLIAGGTTSKPMTLLP